MSRLLYRLSYATVVESPVKLADLKNFVKRQEPTLHTARLKVRTYECDAYGHVNNAVYLNYLEYGRDQYLEHQGLDYQAVVAAGYGIWVAEAKLSYLSPALPGEELEIQTSTQESGAATVLLAQTIVGPGGRQVLEATIKLVWVGATGRPTRIPPHWRASFTGA